jgi:hypothetical protein
VYQQDKHFITRFKDNNDKYYQQDGYDKSTDGYAVPTVKGFPFYRVDNRKLGVLHLVFYVLQGEQEADV